MNGDIDIKWKQADMVEVTLGEPDFAEVDDRFAHGPEISYMVWSSKPAADSAFCSTIPWSRFSKNINTDPSCWSATLRWR